MEQLKKYTLKYKHKNQVWEFNYDIQGMLRQFNILEGDFGIQETAWLMEGRFPYNEEIMKKWSVHLKKHFEIEVDIPEIDFEFFYETYGKKVTKKESLDYWKKKMTKGQHLLATLGIKNYKQHCQKEQIAMLDPIRYLKRERYADEY